MDESRPAYSRDSIALRLGGVESLDDLSPGWAWGGATGKGVRVAVIDSGIEAGHLALEGCVDVDDGIAIGLTETGDIGEQLGPHDDLFGHGTACAGIIHQIAPEARVISVRVLSGPWGGKSAVFLRGLAWAVDQGFEVINLSLGTSKRDWALPFYEVCDEAYFRGSLVVTAANNVIRPSFPSLYSSVTSVACNLSNDRMRFHFNPEPPTEFLARGIDVDVPWLNGSSMTATGNSYAAPHLAGIAALIRSKHAELRPFQVKTVLWATASNVREAGTSVSPAAGRLTVSARMTGMTRGLSSRASSTQSAAQTARRRDEGARARTAVINPPAAQPPNPTEQAG